MKNFLYMKSSGTYAEINLTIWFVVQIFDFTRLSIYSNYKSAVFA